MRGPTDPSKAPDPLRGQACQAVRPGAALPAVPSRSRPGTWACLLAAVALTAAACACEPPEVEDCPRGSLDLRYCDRAGDLVADAPTDRARFRDPERLVFAYTPVEDPAVYREVWADFLDHLEAVTGREVRFFPVQSNAAQIEAMRAGRLHVAGFNTGATPMAVNCSGFVPMKMMGSEDGSFGYEMEIVTHVDSGLETLADLEGRTLAFTTPTSNSGAKAPEALLRSEMGFEPGVHYEVAYSGRHDNSVIGTVNRDYDAAAVANEVVVRALGRTRAGPEDLRILYQSETFPTTAYGVAHDLHPDLAENVREAFASFEWEGTGLEEEFGVDAFIPITYAEHWAVIRDIDAAAGETYACS